MSLGTFSKFSSDLSLSLRSMIRVNEKPEKLCAFMKGGPKQSEFLRSIQITQVH